MSRNDRLCERKACVILRTIQPHRRISTDLTELIRTCIGCTAASFTPRHSLSHSVSGSLVRLTPSSSSYIDVTAVRAVLCRVFDVAVAVRCRCGEKGAGRVLRVSTRGEARGEEGEAEMSSLPSFLPLF